MSSYVPAADYFFASHMKTFFLFLKAGDSPNEHTYGAVLSVYVKRSLCYYLVACWSVQFELSHFTF